MPTGDALTAELWGCLLGLKRAWECGFRSIVLKSDSQEALSLVQMENTDLHEEFALISEIKNMMQQNWKVTLQYIERDMNRRADLLAKHGLAAGKGLQLFGPDAMDSPAVGHGGLVFYAVLYCFV
ncbi:uncharacterized protein LOC114761073 [Neltuma alba]|uniref:uncharacterized protein LOC114761073 n=1 Tax=Neltuma alba TaxID=207710 RepID=UPI0010A4AC00|nr:uncharacterized protein LOC114761073 [Prosopis alba]